MLLGANTMYRSYTRKEGGLIQEFRPLNPSFRDGREGVVFSVSQELKDHLGTVNDTTIIVNCKPSFADNYTASEQGGFFINTRVSAGGYYIDKAETTFKCYCRDGVVCKYLYFQAPSFIFVNKNNNWWEKSISLAFVFEGTQIRVYCNGTRLSLPDGVTTHTRKPATVYDKMVVPYNATNSNTTPYEGEMYSVCFYDHAMTLTEINNQLAKDEEKFGIEFSTLN